MAKERYDQPQREPHPPAREAASRPGPATLEGTEAPADLQRVQQQAAREPPPPVKLEPARDEAGRPADAPPVPPKAAPEPAPRLIHQSERSPDPQKLSRFKVRAAAPFDAQPYHYVLAPKGAKDAAVKCYMEATGLQAVLDTLPEGQRPTPLVTCKELSD